MKSLLNNDRNREYADTLGLDDEISERYLRGNYAGTTLWLAKFLKADIVDGGLSSYMQVCVADRELQITAFGWDEQPMNLPLLIRDAAEWVVNECSVDGDQIGEIVTIKPHYTGDDVVQSLSRLVGEFLR